VPITSRVRRIVTAALALLATPALAVDYWVKNGGDDSASGTSVAQAWATLPHAADRVGPGDVLREGISAPTRPPRGMGDGELTQPSRDAAHTARAVPACSEAERTSAGHPAAPRATG
jgi:hypothetical protein